MHCLVGCLALVFPRIVLGMVWWRTDLVERAYHDKLLWPLLGMLFMPLTALVYAWGFHDSGGSLEPWHIAAVVVAAVIDLGLCGRARRKRKRRSDDE